MPAPYDAPFFALLGVVLMFVLMLGLSLTCNIVLYRKYRDLKSRLSYRKTRVSAPPRDDLGGYPESKQQLEERIHQWQRSSVGLYDNVYS